MFASALGDQQHAFLRLAEHDLVGGHSGLALRHVIKFNLDAYAATRAHFAGGARKTGSAHILNADYRAGLHGFKASFEQQLLQERISDLNVRAFLFGSFFKLLAGHGGAMNAVPSGLGANVNDRISFSRRLGIKDLVLAHETQGKCIH